MEVRSARGPEGEGGGHAVVEMPVVAAAGNLRDQGLDHRGDLKGHQDGAEARHHHHHEHEHDDDDPDAGHAHHVHSDEHPLTTAQLASEHAAAHDAAAPQPAQPKPRERQLFENLTEYERQNWLCCSILGCLGFGVCTVAFSICAAIFPIWTGPEYDGGHETSGGTIGDEDSPTWFTVGAALSAVLMMLSCFACAQLWSPPARTPPEPAVGTASTAVAGAAGVTADTGVSADMIA